jgi:hypothetical protein
MEKQAEEIKGGLHMSQTPPKSKLLIEAIKLKIEN